MPARTVQEEVDALLTAPDVTDEDAALDFVEAVVGRFYFVSRWKTQRDPAALAAWLSSHGYANDSGAVLAELDQLAATATGAGWKS